MALLIIFQLTSGAPSAFLFFHWSYQILEKSLSWYVANSTHLTSILHITWHFPHLFHSVPCMLSDISPCEFWRIQLQELMDPGFINHILMYQIFWLAWLDTTWLNIKIECRTQHLWPLLEGVALLVHWVPLDLEYPRYSLQDELEWGFYRVDYIVEKE